MGGREWKPGYKKKPFSWFLFALVSVAAPSSTSAIAAAGAVTVVSQL